jgi:hypothetical protein
MNEYETLQKNLARGWNTWNTRSVLSHVLLPEGFALNLGLRDYPAHRDLREAQIGRKGGGEEQIHPGPHAYDGSYTELNLKWLGNEMVVQSAHMGEDLVVLVTPLARPSYARRAPLLVVESGILWNRSGFMAVEDGALVGQFAGRSVRVYPTRTLTPDPHVPAHTPYLSMLLDGPVGISTGRPRSVEEIQAVVSAARSAVMRQFKHYGELAEVYRAIQTAMAWDTIYEPEHDRVVSPVSRIWNVVWGGYVLFEWDNYFAAYLASAENREIAYANAVEMTREATESGLVPNFATVNGVASRDRSEPPVGALMCRELYRKFREPWFLEEVFPNLLRWNRWWHERRSLDGLLCWGSDPYEPVLGGDLEREVNHRQGAAWESGLDNLPVYDNAPFDAARHLMLVHDVGLNGLYTADCDALAEIAAVLGRADEAGELRARGAAYRAALARLWDEKSGIYRNRRADTGEFLPGLAPTSFYPLLALAASEAQAARMAAEHFYNPREFWGEWMLPTIARSDPAFGDQDYWRGRIWGPTNFLVYLGLRNYPLEGARKDLADKSVRLLLKEWVERGHVHENYNAITGLGCDAHNSDGFYHWGGLLGMPALIEAGLMPAPEQAL